MNDANQSLTIHDDKPKWRCPQLGGPVTFNYCRRMNEGLPCRQMHACWQETIDVDAFLETNFSSEKIESVFGQPARTRMDTIFDALTRAQSNQDSSS